MVSYAPYVCSQPAFTGCPFRWLLLRIFLTSRSVFQPHQSVSHSSELLSAYPVKWIRQSATLSPQTRFCQEISSTPPQRHLRPTDLLSDWPIVSFLKQILLLLEHPTCMPVAKETISGGYINKITLYTKYLIP